MSKLKEEIAAIKQGEKYNSYMARAEPLVAKYKQYACNFSMSNNNDENVLLTIYRYLDVLRDYVKVDIYQQVSSGNFCPWCGNSVEGMGDSACPSCREHVVMVNKLPKRTSGRNNYDDRNNFYRALVRFQGKQESKLPDELFSHLDQYFKSYRLPTGDIAKSRPLDERGRRVGTTFAMLITALKNLGYSQYYDDARLICRLYWGWTLPDLSPLEDKIMADYDAFQSVYRTRKNNRKSSLNTQLLLYYLLRRNGVPCYREDFKIITTHEICMAQEIMIKDIFKYLNWELK
jgi:hypothetical protein